MYNSKKTNINWITVPQKEENEWLSYKKKFVVDGDVSMAAVRFETDCTCAIFINGEFIISGTGRYPERVNYHEITSKLCFGENTVEVVTGGHYFQQFGYSLKNNRGYWLNRFALELTVEYENSTVQKTVTDESWIVNSKNNEKIIKTAQVTQKEYDTMWLNAALWRDTTGYVPNIPDAVLSVVGQDYKDYANKTTEKTVPFKKIVSTDMLIENDCFVPKKGAESCYMIIDMGVPVVGYTEFEYRADGEVTVTSMFDYSEQITDFEKEFVYAKLIEKLTVTDIIDKNQNFYRNLRRRAFRYIKIIFGGNLNGLAVKSPKVRLCLFPITEKGWFWCSDELLNKVWEQGKYTLHVNKQQEYESCPRNEMLFFVGDGAIDALTDIYSFGNCDMLKASLSFKHEEQANGISITASFNRTVWQWDYFAWRIICIYNYFSHTNDLEFLKQHYNEAENNILWLTERMNDKDLLFQTPAFSSTFSSVLCQVDWACSSYRHGENAFLNCLLYKSFLCVSELAAVMGEENKSKEWRIYAQRVKNAVNKYLWDEEKQSYADGFGKYIAQDSNVFAIIFGVADEEKIPKILSTIKNNLWTPYGSVMADTELREDILRGGNTTISPMMSAYEAQAWFEHDKAEEGLELIRRVWGTMIKKEATTFWEFTPNNAEERWIATCHAWSAGCTYLLSAYVLGFRPAAPNWKKTLFAPQPCDIECGKGVVPTPYGLIAASWKKNGNNTDFTIAVPKEIEIELKLPPKSKADILNY